MTGSQSPSGQDDQNLWEGLRKGDGQALAALFRRHYAMLYNYGVRISHEEELVKDAIQEVFAYLWLKRSTVSDVRSVPAYLLVAMRRQVLKTLEKHRQAQSSHEEFETFQDNEAFSPEDLLIMEETENAEKEDLESALAELPPRMREALYLKTHDGLAYKEIADVMNITPQVARNYVFRAFGKLRGIVQSTKK